MATTDEASIADAQDAILKANITPIQHQILSSFIEKAEKPASAAGEVLRRVRSNADHSVEDVLREFLVDWRRLVATVARATPDPDPSLTDLLCHRDQSRCVLTSAGNQQPELLIPPKPVFIMALSLARLVQAEDGRLRSLMDAFLTPWAHVGSWTTSPTRVPGGCSATAGFCRRKQATPSEAATCRFYRAPFIGKTLAKPQRMFKTRVVFQ